MNQAIDPLKKEKLTTDKIEDALKRSDLRTMRVYIITKLHKPGNLCLSVVNSINYYTAYISKYIDYNLHFDKYRIIVNVFRSTNVTVTEIE